jgi:superoxide reductase
MIEQLAIYKCEVCKITVEVLDIGGGELYCCNQEMRLMEAQTGDPASEKHVPFAEQVEGGIKVRVGQNAAHPMEEKHFIEWIEVVCDGKVCRQSFTPGDAPEATFACTCADAVVREYCNVHGLWKN